MPLQLSSCIFMLPHSIFLVYFLPIITYFFLLPTSSSCQIRIPLLRNTYLRAARYGERCHQMRIYEQLNTHPPIRRYGERSDGIRIQQRLCPVRHSLPFVGNWGVDHFRRPPYTDILGVVLLRTTTNKRQSQGLLKRPNSSSEAATPTVHMSTTTVESQVVGIIPVL